MVLRGGLVLGELAFVAAAAAYACLTNQESCQEAVRRLLDRIGTPLLPPVTIVNQTKTEGADGKCKAVGFILGTTCVYRCAGNKLKTGGGHFGGGGSSVCDDEMDECGLSDFDPSSDGPVSWFGP
jgi:hypothetical protein